MKCLGKSERFEQMMDLTVEIDGEIGTLEEALAQFTATETLDGKNRYHCSRLVHLHQYKFYLFVQLWDKTLILLLWPFITSYFNTQHLDHGLQLSSWHSCFIFNWAANQLYRLWTGRDRERKVGWGGTGGDGGLVTQ